MKIVAGLGSIDDYIPLVKAGADEMFCGFVPHEWNKKYGSMFPLNRREVLYYNIQIGTFEDMKILKKMVDKYKVPVTITFNYLYYLEEQYESIVNIMKNLIYIGFDEFIIADIALILYIRECGLKCKIHLSGECAEINKLSLDILNELNISRYIFHRKNTIEDMKSCINYNKEKVSEYEAFMLNERCHYTGGFCSSFHCDELEHLCKLSYEFKKVDDNINHFNEIDKKLNNYYRDLETTSIGNEEFDEELDNYQIGSTGCGICSLKQLKLAGVTHLKVVGRGNSISNMIRDVEGLKNAIYIMNQNENETIFLDKVKNKIISGECNKNCYY